MIQKFNKIEKVAGELALPGDKSISHRAVIFSAMAKGVSEIRNLSDGEDVQTTINCFQSLGAEIERVGRNVKISGKGYKGFTSPHSALNAGNSGTTARLLTGLLAAQNFQSKIFGDESLSKRPMDRVIDPLKMMGAKIDSADNKTLPIEIHPVSKISSINYTLPVASAQVKSSILICGLHSADESTITDQYLTRDHTERMLDLKSELRNDAKIIYASKKNYPQANSYFVPSDISTASFFIMLALLSRSAELKILSVSLNETRIGLLNLLIEMGGKIDIVNRYENNNEIYGDLIVRDSNLNFIPINSEIIPNIIDEIPILAVGSWFSTGRFQIKDAGELRKKESDRIKSLCYNFKLLGLEVQEFDDGFWLSGEAANSKPLFESFGDHRIAMAFAVLSMLLRNGGSVKNFECAAISNPNFIPQIKSIIK